MSCGRAQLREGEEGGEERGDTTEEDMGEESGEVEGESLGGRRITLLVVAGFCNVVVLAILGRTPEFSSALSVFLIFFCWGCCRVCPCICFPNVCAPCSLVVARILFLLPTIASLAELVIV